MPDQKTIFIAELFCLSMSFLYQGAADAAILVLRQNGQRRQKQLPGISDPGFRKHNMSDNYSAGFGDQRQFRKIKRALPQTVYQIMFIMIGVLGVFKCLFNQFINCGVIRRLFPSLVYHGCSFQLFCSTALRIWQPEKLDYCRPLII